MNINFGIPELLPLPLSPIAPPPPENEDSISSLLRQGKVEEATIVFKDLQTLPEQEQPDFLQDSQKATLLFFAALHAKAETIALALAPRINITYIDDCDKTPLQLAVSIHMKAVARILLLRDAPIDFYEPEDETKFELIDGNFGFGFLQELIADWSIEHESTPYFILYLLQRNHSSLAEDLFNKINTQQLPNWWQANICTELYFAAAKAKLKSMACILAPLVDTTATGDSQHHYTALHYALKNRWKEVVAILIKNGAQFWKTSLFQAKPIFQELIVCCGEKELSQYIDNWPVTKESTYSLIVALLDNHEELRPYRLEKAFSLFNKALEQKALWLTDRINQTRLFLLIAEMNVPTLNTLREKFALLLLPRVEAKGFKCNLSVAPLIAAIQNGWESITRFLIEHGAALNVTDKNDVTAILLIKETFNDSFLPSIINTWHGDSAETLNLIMTLLTHDCSELAASLFSKNQVMYSLNNRTILFTLAVEHGCKPIADQLAAHIDYAKTAPSILRAISSHGWKDSLEYLLKKGAPAQDFSLFELKFSKPWAKRFIDTWPIATPETPKFICDLISSSCPEYATLLLKRITALEPSKLPKWFKDSTLLAGIFCSAAQMKQKELVDLLLPFHLNLAYNQNFPLTLAIRHGWKDTAEKLILQGSPLLSIEELHPLGQSFLESLVQKFPVTSSKAIDFLAELIKIAPLLATRFIKRITSTQTIPDYWKSPTTMTRLFVVATYYERQPLAELFVETMDPNCIIDRDAPICLAAILKWDTIVQRLVARGADLSIHSPGLKSYAYVVIEKSFVNGSHFCLKLLESMPLEKQHALRLLWVLANNNNIEALQVLCKRFESSPPDWAQTIQAKTEINCALIQAKYLSAEALFAASLDLTKCTLIGLYPLMVIAQLGIQGIPHITRSLLSHPKTSHTTLGNLLLLKDRKGNTTLQYFITNFGLETTCKIIDALPLDDIFPLFEEELRKPSGLSKTLLRRLQKEKTPSWWDTTKLSSLFTIALAYKRADFILFLYETHKIDFLHKFGSKGLSALAYIAQTDALSAAKREEILAHILDKGIPLTTKEATNNSLLRYLWPRIGINATHPAFTKFFARFGFKVTPKTECELFQALTNSSKAVQITFHALFSKPLSPLLKKLPLVEKLELIETLITPEFLGKEWKGYLINCAFEIDKTHFALGESDTTLLLKKSSTTISELCSFYENHAHTVDSSITASLQLLQERIKHRRAYLGTPRENSPALAEFYSIIETALCQIIDHFKDNLKNSSPKDAVYISFEHFFSTLSTSSQFCGARVMMDILEQYRFIVLQKAPQTFSEGIRVGLAKYRSLIAQGLFETDKQGVHEFNGFLKQFGKIYGLDTTSALTEAYEDPLIPLADNRRQSVATQFLKQYTPDSIVDFISLELKNREVLDKFIDFLKNEGPLMTWWNEYQIKTILNKYKTCPVQETETWLDNHYIYLDKKDLVSEEALTITLEKWAKTGELVQTSLYHPDGSITTTCILLALIHLNIVRE